MLDHDLFTHRYEDPPTVVLPRVRPAAAQRVRFVDGRQRNGALLAFGIAVAVGLLAITVAGVVSLAGGGGSGSAGSRSGGTSSAADECSRTVLAAFQDGLTDSDVGTAAMQVIDAHGMRSVEHDAWQAALASGAQGAAFQHGAAAGVAAATPAVEQACRSGYGDAVAAGSGGASSLPDDACSSAVLDALDVDRRLATLQGAPGGQHLITVYGSQSAEYGAYTAVLERYMTTSVEYGADRAAGDVAPTVEARCTR